MKTISIAIFTMLFATLNLTAQTPSKATDISPLLIGEKLLIAVLKNLTIDK